MLVYLDWFRNVLLFHLLYRLAIYSKVCFQKHQENMFFAPRLSRNYPMDQNLGKNANIIDRNLPESCKTLAND